MSSQCVLCAERGREREADAGQVCRGCATRLVSDLREILRLAADAAVWIAPQQRTTGTDRPVFTSKPPVNVEAISPELALIELLPGDASSAVPIVEMLEMWERVIREDHNLLAFGPASAMRAGQGTAPLTGVVEFLSTYVALAVEREDFDVVTFADHVRRSVAILRRWDVDLDRSTTRYRMPCPTMTDDGECSNTLHVTSGEDVYCRSCGRLWDSTRLLAVAGQNVDIWLDSEAISSYLGIPIRTIQHWGKTGKVQRRGLLYRLADILASTPSTRSSAIAP
jgi:hypothetical protein